jgi:MarR family transcriptional regulator for hemolysin
MLIMSQDNKQLVAVDRIGFLLHDASRLMRRSFEKNAIRYGLSSAQWRLLVRVFKEEGLTQARLAEVLEVEPISVSRLIDRMEEAGWIERRADAADRRARNIFLTERSRAIFGEMRGIADQVFEKALTGLDDDQRRATIHGLQTIIANLTDDDQKAAATDTEAA